MADYVVMPKEDWQEVLDSIRSRTGQSGLLKSDEAGSQIRAIPSGDGGITPSGTKQITENGTYDVTGFATAEVDVETEEDLTAELTEQDELLTQIEAALGLETIPATLTVNFAIEYEEEIELGDDEYDYKMVYISQPATGSYTIDGGGAVYFEEETSLSIEASVDSVVKITLSIESGCSGEYGNRDAVGCEGDYRCEEEGHEPWDDYYDYYEYEDHCGEFGCKEGAVITITESTASITVYDCFA